MNTADEARILSRVEIQAMKNQFARHWRVKQVRNPLNHKIVHTMLERMPACPLYSGPKRVSRETPHDPEKEPRFDPNHKHDD